MQYYEHCITKDCVLSRAPLYVNLSRRDEHEHDDEEEEEGDDYDLFTSRHYNFYARGRGIPRSRSLTVVFRPVHMTQTAFFREHPSMSICLGKLSR